VGHRLTSALRRYDSVGRYGGEEFLIIVPGCDALNLVVTAERLRHKIADQPVETAAGPIAVTISLGVVAAQANDSKLVDCETLIRHADAALYAAKDRGRNRVEIAPAVQMTGQSGAPSADGTQESLAGIPLGKSTGA
jgi:two-component system cell cycle response regulator